MLLLREPLRVASEALASRGVEAPAVARARHLEGEVRDAALARVADRPILAGAVAHAAFVDEMLHAAALAGRPNPSAPLRDLWATGYVLAAADASQVTLAMPPLSVTPRRRSRARPLP